MDFLNIWNMLFDDDEDNDDLLLMYENRENHIKINKYFEYIALYYSLTDFKSHFRIMRGTFEALTQQIGPFLLDRVDYLKVEPMKQIAIALWVFGNQEVYRSVADRFGVSKSTVWECVFNVAYVLQDHVQNYMKWPEEHALLHSQEQFREMCNFPGVVGAVDGCHIHISAPINNANSYINRKGYHSIILQGICNHNMRFIDVFIGFCGSVHDARVWRLSDIKQRIDEDIERFFPQNTHLLGDSAYPLSINLLTPYRDNGHLNNIQINYNTKLSQTRIIIERTFGILKSRFRKLRYVLMYNTELIPLVILACCILHNICIDNEDEPFELDYNENEENEYENDHNIFLNSEEKRDIIANVINF